MTQDHRQQDGDRDARLRALGIDPDRLVDERDVQYLLGDAFRDVGIDFGKEQQEAVVCTLLGYRHPDSLAIGDRAPNLRLHPLDLGPPVEIGQLHAARPLVLFFGSYT
jgi:hypothetical protein